MPEILDATFFLIAIPAVIFAGISKGGFGAGAAFAATPLLALILEPGAAIGLMLPLLMLMDVTALRLYWRKWDAGSALALVVGATPGILLAALLYAVADQDTFRLLIGFIAVGFVFYQYALKVGAIKASPRPISGYWGLFWGSIAGFTSFISHAGGPPAAIYLLSKQLDKTRFQATTVITFWAINLFKSVPYFYLGIYSQRSILAGFILIPAALFGVWLGAKLHRGISERTFFSVTYVLLLVTGIKLIWDAIG